MNSWTFQKIENLLSQAEDNLHPNHRAQFQKIRVPPYRAPVATHPGESVIVAAKYEDKILYWSDIEEGWEIDTPRKDGSIRERGCNQFELSHLMWQLFGDPERTLFKRYP